MENFEKVLNNLMNHDDMPDCDISAERGINIGICWSEDYDGNINFDIETIRQNLEDILYVLEQHNEETEFDWDNSI
jgi:hypothetical protein